MYEVRRAEARGGMEVGFSEPGVRLSPLAAGILQFREELE